MIICCGMLKEIFIYTKIFGFRKAERQKDELTASRLWIYLKNFELILDIVLMMSGVEYFATSTVRPDG